MLRIVVELDIPDWDLIGIKEQLAMALEAMPGVRRVFIPRIETEQQKMDGFKAGNHYEK